MNTQNHLNMDSGAQGGDNEDQVPQIAGLNTQMEVSDATGGPIPSGAAASGTRIPGGTTGDDNAGASFNPTSVSKTPPTDSDTKNDQSDYSTSLANDGLLSSSDSNGQTDGATGAGSVENAAVSMGDINKGAGAGSGPLTGGR